MKNAWNKYHNKGGRQKAAECYKENADVIKFESKNKYKNMSKKEKKKKRKYQKKVLHASSKRKIKAISERLLCINKN